MGVRLGRYICGEKHVMDLLFLGLTALFFALTWGFVEYSDRLMREKR
jgi:hypothetical protein